MLAIEAAVLDEPWLQPRFRADSVSLWVINGDVGHAVRSEGCHAVSGVCVSGLFAGVDDCGGEEFRVEVAVFVWR